VLAQIGFGVSPPGTPGGGWGVAEAASDSPEPRKRGRQGLVRGGAARTVRHEGNLGVPRGVQPIHGRARESFSIAEAGERASARPVEGAPDRTASLLDGGRATAVLGARRPARACRRVRHGCQRQSRSPLERPKTPLSRSAGRGFAKKPAVRAARDPGPRERASVRRELGWPLDRSDEGCERGQPKREERRQARLSPPSRDGRESDGSGRVLVG
jgi:hypothetical protein